MTTSISNGRRATAATAMAPILWGTTYVTITEFLPGGRPVTVASMRVGPAALVLLLIGRLKSDWRPRGADWWRTAALALTNFGVFFPLLIVAVYRLPGGVAAAAGGLQPLFVVALSWLVARRPPRSRDLLVGCVAAVGVAMVVVRGGQHFDGVGVLAAVGANASFALGIVLTKHFPSPANRLSSTGWQLLMSAIVLVPFAVVVEGSPPTPTVRHLLGFGYLSLVATAAAFVVWFSGIRRLPSTTPPLLGLIAPIVGAMLGWIVLGESLTPLQLCGFAVTSAAIAHGSMLGAASDHPSMGLANLSQIGGPAVR